MAQDQQAAVALVADHLGDAVAVEVRRGHLAELEIANGGDADVTAASTV